eukprot:COSAG02_NODE_2784_length_8036_cov_15.324808_1_plen_538_part_10
MFLRALALALSIAVLEVPKAMTAHVGSPYQTGATLGAVVQKDLDAAISKGAKAFALPAGNIIFNSTDFLISGAKNIVIQGHYSTLLWFSDGAGVRVHSCSDVTISTLAINYWVLPYVQGTVVSTTPATGGNSTYRLQLAQRSANPDKILPQLNLANGGAVWKMPKKGMTNEAKISSMISTCATPPPEGPFPTGVLPCPLLDYSSTGTSLVVTLPTISPAVAAGDMMTFKASAGHTYVVANSTAVVTNLLTIHAAGWMAVYEVDGMGGNTYRTLKIEPDDGYLIGSNADGFHSTDVARGPTLVDSSLRNILNDFFSTHSTIHVLGVVPATIPGSAVLAQPRAWAFGSMAGDLVDEFYGTASPMSNVIPGKDSLTCYALNTFARLGTATITEVTAIHDEKMNAGALAAVARLDSTKSATPAIQTWDAVALWSVKLSTEIPTSGGCCQLCTLDRFGGRGASITNNHFVNGAALLGRTKSSDAMISGNTWDNTATHTLEITALQPFMEGPVDINNVSIVDNTFIDSTTNGTSPVSAGPNATH